MPLLLLGIFNNTTADIAVGAPSHIVGNATWAIDPDPVTGNSISAGMYDSAGGPDLELTFNPTIAPAVTLFIDIWIQRTTFEKLIVRSSDPTNYPIQGKYGKESDGSFYCNITVGRAVSEGPHEATDRP